MRDIVEKLRDVKNDGYPTPHEDTIAICEEAADIIERLRGYQLDLLKRIVDEKAL